MSDQRVSGNLYGVFASRFPADRGRPFAETVEGRRHTYADLETTVGRIARLLIGLGVKPGDRIAVQVEKSAEAAFLYLACLRVGAVFMPLATAYRPAETAFILADATPAVVVAAPEIHAETADAARQAGARHVLTLDAAGGGSLIAACQGLDPDAPVTAVDDDDLAAIVYTSGTTGRAKGAMLPHGQLAWNADAIHQLWGWRSDDVLLHALPFAFGIFGSINLVLMNGSGMILLPRFDADAVVRLLPRATVFIGVPTYYTRLLAHPGFDRAACRNMRLFVTGSAPLRADTFHAFRERTGHTLLDRYGMTELLLFTSNPLKGERLPNTSGPPVPGVQLRVVDADGRPVAPGEVGMIEVRLPRMFKGYWRMPERAAIDFRPDGYFITGDLGVLNPNGYVSVVGRGKDLIISGGFNVYPKEVEVAIDAIPGVVESAVVGVPHPDFEEGVIAIVRRQPGSAIDEPAIIAALKQRLANFKVAKRVFFVDELPRNALGKVQKNLLRERFKDAFAGIAASPADRPRH